MKHRLIRWTAPFLLTLASLPASAGVYYKAETTGDVDGKASPPMVVEAWIDGENARIEFRESASPVMSEGTYMVTTDGGQTLYLVNPEDKTYSRFDLEAMLQFVGSVTQSMGPMLKLEISDPQVEQLLEEGGGNILGYSTDHFRYRTTYSMKVKVLGMGRNNQIDTVQDLWVTDALSTENLALGVWMRKEPPATGNPELDKLIDSEIGKITGFPLRTETVSTTVGGKRGQHRSVSHSVTEITELRRGESVDGSRFGIPEGYTETQILPTGSEEEEGGLFGGLFGGRNKDKDKDR